MVDKLELLKPIKPIEQGALEVAWQSGIGFKFSEGAQAVTAGEVALNFGVRYRFDQIGCLGGR